MSAAAPQINVADFSTHLSGPTASLFLRACGAKVVKIENPRHGDGNRHVPSAPTIADESIYHHALNWGAESVTADPKSDEWSSWVAAFAEWADVVLVGGRARDNERLGLSREQIAEINPRAVYCHISAYGPSGPWRDRPAHGQNPDALAGLVDVIDGPDGNPASAGWRPAGTTLAGVIAAIGILAALLRRSQSGEVAAVETSLWESAVWWNWRQITAKANLGSDWGILSDLGSRYAIYTTADSRPLLIAPIEERFWNSFCEAAGLEQLRGKGDWSERLYFGEEGPDSAERAEVAECVRRFPLARWIELLEPRHIPFCEILRAEDVIRSDHFEALQMLLPLEGGGSVIRPPLTFLGQTPEPTPYLLPSLGAHTEVYRQQFGINDQ